VRVTFNEELVLLSISSYLHCFCETNFDEELVLLSIFSYLHCLCESNFDKKPVLEILESISSYLHCLCEELVLRSISSSVADPWHFGVDPDPDPRIHASD
jgi:hypothetical protein